MLRVTSHEDFWTPPVVLFSMQFLVFLVALWIKDNSIVDITWGINIALSNTIILIVANNWHARTIVTLSLIWIWAIRMAIYVSLKHKGEDWRFAEMRKKWNQTGGACLVFVCSLGFFIMSGVTMFLVSNSAHFIMIYSHKDDDLFVLEWIGWIIIILGISLELVADLHLLIFTKNPKNSRKILKSGLWRVSRHPNFFFECVVWWGVYIVSCSLKLGCLTAWSAILITVTLRFISGVPLIEKKYKEREDFQLYKKETNCFIPWFPKSMIKPTEVRNLDSPNNSQKMMAESNPEK